MHTTDIDKMYWNEDIKGKVSHPEITTDVRVGLVLEALKRYRERALSLEGVPEQINQYIAEHEREVCRGYCEGGAPARLKVVIQHYRDVATNALASCERFRMDLHAWLRGMVICMEMTGNAGTHAEKAARLRGQIELTEAVIKKVIDERFNFENPYWRWNDTFRSDFPTRALMERNNDLKREVEDLQIQVARLKGEPVSDEQVAANAPW